MKDNKTPALLKLLRKELEAGKYPVNSRFPSEYDLANRFDINKTTANKLVATLVAEGLLARGKRGCGTLVLKESPFPKGQIAFLIQLSAAHVGAMLQGAVDYAQTRRYTVTPLSPMTNPTRMLSMLPGSPFKGVLTTAYDMVEAPAGIPVIHLDQNFSPSDIVHHSVNADIYNGAEMMMKEALKAGHREIVITVTDVLKIHMDQVVNGYKNALLEAGYDDADQRIFVISEYSPHNFRQVLKKILKKYPDVTLIATESDNDVARFCQIIEDDCPEYKSKIKFSGFGHLKSLAEHYNFATVDQHFYQLGSVAAEKMIDMLENGKPDQVIRETVPCELCNLKALALK